MNDDYDVLIQPATLHGEMRAIPSKSDFHRKLICAALSNVDSRIRLTEEAGEYSQDIRATLGCLRALGAVIEEEKAFLKITPIRQGTLPCMPLLDCGESGSTLRFLLCVCAALGCGARFTAAGRLPQRPLGALRDTLSSHGVRLSPEGVWPLCLEGQLQSGSYTIPGNISSQYFSGLLMGLPLLTGSSELHWSEDLESAGYIELTRACLEQFEITTTPVEQGWSIPGAQTFHAPAEITIEGDWSNAAFWIAAGALSGGMSLRGLDPKSLQSDRAILTLLQRAGASIEVSPHAIQIAPASLHGIQVDVAPIPDLVPIWAVVGALSKGTTAILNAGRLRIKESDRLAAISTCLRDIGADVIEQPDALIIHGKPELAGGCVSSFNDHRIAMSMAIAGCKCKNQLMIKHAEAVNKSYPGFFRDYQLSGGQYSVINHRNEY